jgi:hypothetical protein
VVANSSYGDICTMKTIFCLSFNALLIFFAAHIPTLLNCRVVKHNLLDRCSKDISSYINANATTKIIT